MPIDEDQRTTLGRLETFLEREGPRGLSLTYSFDAPRSGEPFDLAVRFVGLRQDVDGRPGSADEFDRTERVNGLFADGGRVSVTTRVAHANPGEWRVLAQPASGGDGPAAKLPRRVLAANTRFWPLAHGPRVRVLGWPALVGLGAVVALLVQASLASREGIDPLGILAVSVVACVLGFLGGKLWYLALSRKPLTEFFDSGAGIQGFLLVALTVLAAGAFLLDAPVGTVLDVTIPGVFLGIGALVRIVSPGADEPGA